MVLLPKRRPKFCPQYCKNWIEREGRKQTWVAQQVGCSPQWLNYVIKGKKPLSDKLAQTLQDKLGIPLMDEKTGKTGARKKVRQRER